MSTRKHTVEAEFKATTSGLRSEMKSAGTAAEGFAKDIAASSGKAGDALAALGPAGAAAAVALGALTIAGGTVAKILADATNAASDYGGKVNDISLKTGASAEAIQKIGFAAELGGASMEAAAKSVGKFEQTLGEGTDKARGAVNDLGLSFDGLKAMKPEDAFAVTAEAIAKVGNQADQARIAAALFGKSYTEILPAIKDGFGEAAEKAERLGLVMSNDTVAGLDKFGDATATLTKTWDHLWMNIGAQIANTPELTDAIDALAEAIGGVSKEFQDGSGPIQAFTRDTLAPLVEEAAAAVDIVRAMLGMGIGGTAGSASAASKDAQEWAKAERERETKAKRAADLLRRGGKPGALSITIGDEALTPFAKPNRLTGGGGKPDKEAEAKKKLVEQEKEYQKEIEQRELAEQRATEKALEGMKAIEDKLSDTSKARDELADRDRKRIEDEMQRRMDASKVVADADGDAEFIQRHRMDAAKEQAFDYSGAVMSMADAWQLMGGSADAALGKIIGGMAAAAAGGEQLKKALASGDIMATAMSLANSFALLEKSTRGGGMKGLMGGLTSGAGAGSAFGPQGAAAGAYFGGSFALGRDEKIRKKLGTGGTIAASLINPAFGAGVAFDKLFGGDKAKGKQLKNEFLEASGGLDELKKKAGEANVSLDALLSAKGTKNTKAAIDDVKGGLDQFSEAQRRNAEAMRLTQEAADRYGLSVEELGPKWAQQQLDVKAGQLLTDYTLLTAKGADNVAVLTKMAPAMNEYVNASLKAGTSIPENMKEPLTKMAEMGLLTDEAGNKMENLDGVNFTKTLSEGLQDVVDEIHNLVDAIKGIPPEVKTTYTIGYRYLPDDGKAPVGGGNTTSTPFFPEDVGGVGADIYAAAGFFSPSLPSDMVIQAHAGEAVSIVPASVMGADGGGLGQPGTAAPGEQVRIGPIILDSINFGDLLLERTRRGQWQVHQHGLTG